MFILALAMTLFGAGYVTTHSKPQTAKSRFAGMAPVAVGLTLAVAGVALSTPQVTEPEIGRSESNLTVHFIDVGQGDATLLQGSDFTLLIDAGRHDRNDVVPYLRSVGVTEIDLLVGTHPHADHIGQFDRVLAELPVAMVWLSGDEHTTRTFERTLDAILATDAGYHEPRAGERFNFGSAQIEVVNPDRLTGNLHEGSISLRLLYGDIAFLFTGDAERHTEQAMIDRGHDLRAHILQLGHHGSRTSSTAPFLQAVQPEAAIYSAGRDNRYGHPHDEVVERLAQMGIATYGTNVHGTVRVNTDGETFRVHVAQEGAIRGRPQAVEQAADEEPEPAMPGCRSGQVDINTASIEELTAIIHIGESRAEQIVDLRPFDHVNNLTRVRGISTARLEDIQDQNVACVSTS